MRKTKNRKVKVYSCFVIPRSPRHNPRPANTRILSENQRFKEQHHRVPPADRAHYAHILSTHQLTVQRTEPKENPPNKLFRTGVLG